MTRSSRELSSRSSELDPASDLVALAAHDVIGVGLVLAVGDAQHGGDDLLAEARLTQFVGGDRGVLDHVMEDGHDLGLCSLDAHHHPQRMEDVRQP